MIFTPNVASIIEDTYPGVYIYKVDVSHMLEYCSKMTLDKCKIVISGKNILLKDQFKGSKQQVEKWFKTKFKVIPVPLKQIT